MLAPKKQKFRKAFKGRIHGNAKGGFDLAFGSFGLKAIEPERITARQIEAARRVLTRYIKRGGKIWIRIFPDHPVTKKGNEVPMGSGKGAVDHYVSVVRAGTVMFEMDGIPEASAKEAMISAGFKLATICKFITKDV